MRMLWKLARPLLFTAGQALHYSHEAVLEPYNGAAMVAALPPADRHGCRSGRPAAAAAAAAVTSLPVKPPDAAAVAEAAALVSSLAPSLPAAANAAPLSISVGSAAGRSRIAGVASHVWSQSLPRGSFCAIGQGIYVSSLELCFLQLASVLELRQLIYLGFELCGTYGMGGFGAGGKQPDPLSSTARLAAFLSRTPGVPGHKKAMRAMKYIIDNSASQAESQLAMTMCLPYMLGGFGLPKPILNCHIALREYASKATRQQDFYCDAFWPEYRLALEYDSDQYHTGAKRIAADAARRNSLAYGDILVVTATKADMNNIGRTKRLAQIMAKHLRKRLTYKDPGFSAKLIELHRVMYLADQGIAN